MSEITRETPFRVIPALNRPLLLVASEIDIEVALREADDLEHAVRCILARGIETGLEGSEAYLCEFALQIAAALRAASSLRAWEDSAPL
jgi:hypothetical protein